MQNKENSFEDVKFYSYEITLTSRYDDMTIKRPIKYKLLSLSNNKEEIIYSIKEAFDKVLVAFELEFDTDKI